jgi:hypothetical protein
MIEQRTLKMLISMAAIFAFSGCASLLDSDLIQKSDPLENEVGSMEPYIDCLRDKKREETDPPCLLK